MHLLFAALALFTTAAHAFDIPKGLTDTDRLEIVRTLGLNTATKMLDNPYPLGGYSGFEVGYSIEYVNIRDIRRLGCVPGSAGCANSSYSEESEWRYSRFTIGKGLYNDLDVFFHLIPPMGGVHAGDYGGALRWSFYQARFLPINVSAILHYDQLNYGDSFVNRNVGSELMVGVNVENFALYFGGGQVHASGTFIGGTCSAHCTFDSSDPSYDKPSRTVTDRVISTHTVVGLSLHFENLFAAAEVDRYQDAVYSLKAGIRY